MPYIVKTTNIENIHETMRLILSHKPMFTLGHNVYGFENKVLALALGSDRPMSVYFKQSIRSDLSTFGEFGCMMNIPGINNIDTYAEKNKEPGIDQAITAATLRLNLEEIRLSQRFQLLK